MNVVRILFTSAGRRVELTRCFRRAAEKLGMRAEIHACDLEPELSAACLEAEAAFKVPRCTDPDYVARLLDHCAREKIALLVPTIDTELDVLSRTRDRFAEVGTMVHVARRRSSTSCETRSAPLPCCATRECRFRVPRG
ncbi:hypothetical protein [Novosphingobium sp. ST904]|uniref:hypothetical protein n=1 Tax=Novosphingobium sp. ST904 TaxID=1684385 RepID=UPI0018D012BE|nr:hypothetical protein [Novosphingobium sp. ST904]